MARKRIRAKMAVPSKWHRYKIYGYCQQLVYVTVANNIAKGGGDYLRGTRWEAWYIHTHL